MSERTIVVESDGSNNNNQYPMYNFSTTNNLLDEGSLLLLKVVVGIKNANEHENHQWVKELSSLSTNENNDNGDEVAVVIPLGKVLEVFGPISKPLYTVRLLLSSSTGPKRAPASAQTSASIPVATPGESKKEEQQQQQQDNCSNEKGDNKGNNGGDKSDHGEQEDQIKNNVENKEKEVEKESPSIISGDGEESVTTVTDPWSEDGVLTKWLHENPKQEIYYATNQVKFVDTQSVVRNSRKGCGTFAFMICAFTTNYVFV